MTPESTWILGILFGDGNIDKRGSRIRIAVGDLLFANQIKNVMGMGNVVYEKYRKGGCYLLDFYSSLIVQELKEDFGLMPNKTGTMIFPIIKDDLLPHFIRGLSDADGCFAINKRSTSSPLRWAYTSKSENFMKSLRDILISHCDINYIKFLLNKDGNFTLEYAHKSSISIGNWIYANSNETTRNPYKFNVFQNCLLGELNGKKS